VGTAACKVLPTPDSSTRVSVPLDRQDGHHGQWPTGHLTHTNRLRNIIRANQELLGGALVLAGGGDIPRLDLSITKDRA
jgi:hypothetical protein